MTDSTADDEIPTAPAVASDTTLINLNVAIEAALREYLPSDVAIRFDLPPKDSTPDVPTVCIFLYDIQEDLQLRVGEGRKFNSTTGVFAPGYVNIRCCYLVTYFEVTQSSSSDSPLSQANSQSLIIINNVLNALVNNRSFSTLPGTYLRVIPPSEQLNSLGNFWQAVGNTPRLCLSYMVTVPLKLTDLQTTYTPVNTTSVLSAHISNDDTTETSES
ncbi:Pvc16 family protein [Kosakonia sp. BK9b]|uniref:Pvc16 family protein n=1 Tax=Kosakonia sp. TaxID=1916651 RepID=UPI00289B4DAF|nr:Pvc16 family protein [Kosakonia sp.]